MDGLVHPDFWLSLGQIILIDLLLRGDSAVGAMLLGSIAGTLLVGDPALSPYIDTSSQVLRYQAGGVGAVLVFVVGRQFARRRMASTHPGETTHPRQSS